MRRGKAMWSFAKRKKRNNRNRPTNDPYVYHFEITVINKFMEMDTKWMK